MALITTVTPTVSEDPHRPGIPDDAETLAGNIDRDTIEDWGFDSTFAFPTPHFDVTPDWGVPDFDMGDGVIYRHEPSETYRQRRHDVASVSGVSLASDSTNYVFYTSANEFEVHDADDPPSDQAVLVATLDTSTNTVDTDVRGRSPIPPAFVQAVQTEATSQAPTVTTADADSIADNSLQLSAILDDLGGAGSVEVYIQYRQQGNTAWNETSKETAKQTGTFDFFVDSLSAGTTYEFRAVALSPSGLVGFGAIKDETTTNDGTTNPAVSTTSASSITASSADLGGDLTSLGSYSSVDVFAEFRSLDRSDVGSSGGQTVSATGTFTESVNGLRQDTGYEYRAVARSSAGEIYGDWVGFTTSAGTALNVTTDAADNIGQNSADLNGTVTSFGGASSASVNFNYRVQGNSVWRQTPIETITTTLSFVDTVDQLVADTTYEFQARAATSTDSATGVVDTFTTLSDIIDDFEDNDLSEYQTGSGSWTTQTGTVRSGTYAAQSPTLSSSASSNLASDSGLAIYPSAGDTFEVHFRFEGTTANHNFFVNFGIQDATDFNAGRYRLRADEPTSEISLGVVDTNGNFSQLASSSLAAMPTNDWLVARVDWGGSGSITCTIEDSSGTQLGQVSATDTTYTSGGIGYAVNLNPDDGGDLTGYVDDVVIV